MNLYEVSINGIPNSTIYVKCENVSQAEIKMRKGLKVMDNKTVINVKEISTNDFIESLPNQFKIITDTSF